MKSVIFLFFLIACHRENGPATKSKKTLIDSNKIYAEDLEKEETITYLAEFKPVNSLFAGEVSGSFTFHKKGDLIVANVRVSNSSANLTHLQKVLAGTSCPSETSDLNLDGFVDVLEAEVVSGKVIIPLDMDINDQYSLLGAYPISDAWGSYVYSKTASFLKFMEDLRLPDINPDDNVIKPDLPLGLSGKVIMLYGIPDEIVLPETVSTNDWLSSNQTLPIACGVIQKVLKIPGEFEPDDVIIGTIPRDNRNPIPAPRRPGPRNQSPSDDHNDRDEEERGSSQRPQPDSEDEAHPESEPEQGSDLESESSDQVQCEVEQDEVCRDS